MIRYSTIWQNTYKPASVKKRENVQVLRKGLSQTLEFITIAFISPCICSRGKSVSDVSQQKASGTRFPTSPLKDSFAGRPPCHYRNVSIVPSCVRVTIRPIHAIDFNRLVNRYIEMMMTGKFYIIYKFYNCSCNANIPSVRKKYVNKIFLSKLPKNNLFKV